MRSKASPNRKRKKPYPANLKSRKYLEAEGWTCCTVESIIPGRFWKWDAYNFGDILACSPSRGIMLVQVTAGANMADRIKKVKANPKHAIWLASGGRIHVHCWVKRARQRGRVLRYMEITLPNPDYVTPGRRPFCED